MGYLFYMDFDGWIPAGNDGQLVIPRSIRTRRGMERLAKSWLANRAGRVYYMSTWTQAMSELGPWNFCYYIKEHGEVICHSPY